MAARRRSPRNILVIDIGGSHVKFRIGARGTSEAFVSGPDLTPARMMRGLHECLGDARYDAVSIGYPGMVFHGRIVAEPHNLGKGWVRCDFERALGKPVRIVNDAAMQAIGSYSGGCMLFLGLGTGLGATLVIDGVVEPTEIGHLSYKNGRTFEEYVGERGRKRLGNKKWRKTVMQVIADLKAAFEVDYVVLGGGNASRLKKLPKGVRLGDNHNAITGGLRLWRGGVRGLRLDTPHGRR